MTDSSSRPDTDPTVEAAGLRDAGGHYSGEEADVSPATPGKTLVGASNGGVPVADAGPEAAHGRDMPPDAGRRAWVDPKTGAVHGSGAGAGGGNPGEDYDPDTAGGGDNVQAERRS